MAGNEEVITLLFDRDPQTAESLGNNAEVRDAYVGDTELGIGHGSHTDEATNLNHIGKHRVLCTVKLLNPLDREAV